MGVLTCFRRAQKVPSLASARTRFALSCSLRPWLIAPSSSTLPLSTTKHILQCIQQPGMCTEVPLTFCLRPSHPTRHTRPRRIRYDPVANMSSPLDVGLWKRAEANNPGGSMKRGMACPWVSFSGVVLLESKTYILPAPLHRKDVAERSPPKGHHRTGIIPMDRANCQRQKVKRKNKTAHRRPPLCRGRSTPGCPGAGPARSGKLGIRAGSPLTCESH